jgi:hypothetical protein
MPRPNVYAVQNGLLRSDPPHEMSYPTAQKLQYGGTRAQSPPDASTCSGISALQCVLHHTAILRKLISVPPEGCFQCRKAASWRVDSAPPTEYLYVPPLRGGTFLSQDRLLPRSRSRSHAPRPVKPSVQTNSDVPCSATSHLLPSCQGRFGFERGEGCWLTATNGVAISTSPRRCGGCVVTPSAS